MTRHTSKIEDFASEASRGVIRSVTEALSDDEQSRFRLAHDQVQAVDRADEFASQAYYDGKSAVEPA